MSGIVGIVNLNGAPVDKRLLRRMTDSMAYRGPDARELWSNGCVGFGHTMLRTTWESEHEQQPCSLDGKIWITADARVDARKELIDGLRCRGCRVLSRATDAELILHAYKAWGQDCVYHLIGDFAFAIWDGRNRRLFCARDHSGIKPFFYATLGRSFFFSNTLNCLRSHPAVSNRLDDLAIADFLLFTRNVQFDQTTFSDIRKIPPAHTLMISSDGGPALQRYWSVPRDKFIRYSRFDEYVDHFREVFTTAVSDRLRTNSVSILMSGGLDSSSVAATAAKLGTASLRAHTMVYDRIMPDRERYYSGLVAKYLDIPIRYQVLDDYRLYQGWDDPAFCRPEPVHNPLDAIGRDLYASGASTARVVLSGDGGDPAFLASGTYLQTLLKSGRLPIIFRSAMHIWQTTRRIPRIGVRTLLKRTADGASERLSPPEWLNPRLIAEYDLSSRLNTYWEVKHADHPRAEAFDSLEDPYWSWFFEQEDPGVAREHGEVRYPYFDRRVLEFVVGIAPIPWCVEKHIVRVAMKGMLPDEVRLRPKTPLVSDGMSDRHAQAVNDWSCWSKPLPELARFVEISRIPSSPPRTAKEFEKALLPLSLNWWLRNLLNHAGTNGTSHECKGKSLEGRTAEHKAKAI